MPATPSPRSNRPIAKLVITVRGTAFEKAEAEGGSASVEAASGPGDAGISELRRSWTRQVATVPN